MRTLLAAALIALGSASSDAYADATARVIVNGQTVIDMSSVTGMTFYIRNEAPFLRPGESADFRYTWSVQVQDDGLPHVYTGPSTGFLPPNGCTPLIVTVCGPQPAGVEQAKASLEFGYTDFRSLPFPPDAFELSVEGPSFRDLMTNTGPEADSLLRTGETIVHVRNVSSTFAGAFPFSTWAAGWTYANPIPEPSSWALMLTGLAVVGLTAVRSRGAGPRAGKASATSMRPVSRNTTGAPAGSELLVIVSASSKCRSAPPSAVAKADGSSPPRAPTRAATANDIRPSRAIAS
jgi:hypothetical protein